MTIKNISNKIINIGTTVLMPDMSMTASEAVCNTPAIKAFAKLKLVEVIKPVEAPKASKKDAEQGNQEPDAPAFDGEKPKKAEKPKK